MSKRTIQPNIIIDYNEYLKIDKNIEHGLSIMEKTLNSDDIRKINRLKKSSHISNILKSINKLSDKIKKNVI